jgi:dipeptidyl aminopeptidase/acylaminoacyl peptidase
MPRRPIHFVLALAIAAGGFPTTVVAQKAIPIERLMSSPFPNEMVAAPVGGKVAWVFNDEGVRNIWVAERPDFEARQLTAYSEDDGEGLSDLAWAPDGSAIVYVRGGAPNRHGEYPNPLSLAAGTARHIWIVSLEGGEPRKLAEGASPAISFQGDAVAFLKGGDVWSVPVDSGDAHRLMQARGGIGSLRWSPDGSRLAFTSSRGDHGFVGVLALRDSTISWLDPGVDRDVSPVWSPDGSRIAFIRLPAESDDLPFLPERSGQPWSIRIADVETGEGRQIWRAEEGIGSVFRGLEAEDQLLWGTGDRLVFPWEADGWTHLYSVPAGGGDATLLTPGEFEVEHVALSPDRNRIIYSSNQGDIDRRHLWQVPVDGISRPAALTEGDGIEWSPAPLAEGGAIAFLRSDARLPAQPALLAASGAAIDLAPEAIPEDFPSKRLVVPEQVVFPAADGMEIHGQLFMPARCRRDGDCPGVLFFHGGSRRQMLLGWHYRGYYHNAYALNQHLASRGFVVLSVNYRSGIGYGMEFREALDYGAAGASEYNDVVGAGLYLAGRAEVDSARIGLWGGSYGGYLTALGLARASELFAAGVDFHGVHDWNVVIENFRPDYDPLEHPEAARVALESSPMADIERWRSPVLLIHGDDDRNVPFSETVDLVEALREQGVEYELLVFPDEVHGFLTHARWLQAYRAAADFLERKLGSEGVRAETR